MLMFGEQFYFKENKDFTLFTTRSNGAPLDIAAGLPLHTGED